VGPCFVTGREYQTTGIITARMIHDYQNGAHVQHAFPDLSAGDREFIISGTSPEGWKILFPPESEDEGLDHEEYPTPTVDVDILTATGPL